VVRTLPCHRSARKNQSGFAFSFLGTVALSCIRTQLLYHPLARFQRLPILNGRISRDIGRTRPKPWLRQKNPICCQRSPPKTVPVRSAEAFHTGPAIEVRFHHVDHLIGRWVCLNSVSLRSSTCCRMCLPRAQSSGCDCNLLLR